MTVNINVEASDGVTVRPVNTLVKIGDYGAFQSVASDAADRAEQAADILSSLANREPYRVISNGTLGPYPLAFDPGSQNYLEVYLSGNHQVDGIDYDVVSHGGSSGRAIQFRSDSFPDGILTGLPIDYVMVRPLTPASITTASSLHVSGNATVGGGLQVNGQITGDAVTQSATDTTAGRILKVGDGALLGVSSLLSPDDFNSLGDVGRFIGQVSNTSGVSNTPLASGLSGFQSFAAPFRGAQLLIRSQGAFTGNRAFFRGKDSTWAKWSELIHKDNLLGAVSQSGGVPTGAVIESGSNANGEYVRFADGTQICRISAISVSAITTVIGALFRPAGVSTWTFPAAFVANPVAMAAVDDPDCITSSLTPTTTSVGIRTLSLLSKAGPVNVRGLAIGRWF